MQCIGRQNGQAWTATAEQSCNQARHHHTQFCGVVLPASLFQCPTLTIWAALCSFHFTCPHRRKRANKLEILSLKWSCKSLFRRAYNLKQKARCVCVQRELDYHLLQLKLFVYVQPSLSAFVNGPWKYCFSFLWATSIRNTDQVPAIL